MLVLGNDRKVGVSEAVAEVRPRLEKDFGVAAVDLKGDLDIATAKAGWCLVFGGDGAMLNAARRMAQDPIPTLGVNFGKFGFLTEVRFSELSTALDRIASDQFRIRERLMLLAQVRDWQVYGLNDVVVHGAPVGRLFRFNVLIEKRKAAAYAGDGLVIATPTGSTAYNLAAGGPILDPDLRAIAVTPLAAHSISQRPIVIPDDHSIEIRVQEEGAKGLVSVDGQVRREIGPKDVLRVETAEKSFKLVRVGVRSYYSILRQKLGWSGAPKYRPPARR